MPAEANFEKPFTDLEKAAKEQELDITIDLGVDRLVRWLGVYCSLSLAVILKVAEAASVNVSCHPVNTSEAFTRELASFASYYCWDTSKNFNFSYCQSGNKSNLVEVMKFPTETKIFVKTFPYLLLLEAFLLSLPWAYWHFRFGARLVGHLKFMQLFLTELFAKVKTVRSTIYNHKTDIYDEESNQFDGLAKYKPFKKHNPENPENAPIDPSVSPESTQLLSKPGLIYDYKESTNGKRNIHTDSITEVCNPHCPRLPGSLRKTLVDRRFYEIYICGELKDRHFFSMLCCENFASMHQLPYILSVFRVTTFTPRNLSKLVQMYLDEALLHEWCHERNLTGTCLVMNYFLKNIVTAFLALMMFCWWTSYLTMVLQNFSADTFFCQLPDGRLCLLCFMQRKHDLSVVFTVVWIMTLSVVLFLMYWWYAMRGFSEKVDASFFKQLQETTSIALYYANWQAENIKNE